MPFANHRLGLSLSGGGYRAAAFHLGTLKKLDQLGILEKVDVLSTISGGSIIGASYCTTEKNFPDFERELYESLQSKNVIRKLLLSPTFLQLIVFALIFLAPAFYFLFAGPSWLFPVLVVIFFFLLFKFQFSIFPVSRRIEKIYDEFFYGEKKLKDLNEKPILVVGSTNLQTGRPFTFTKDRMTDSTYGYMKPSVEFLQESFPIARAVMASSCVPFAFTPIPIAKEFFKNVEQDYHRVNPQLVDGGVYDNQGIHKVMQTGRYACDNVITSDAGNKLSYTVSFRNTISLLIRTVDVFMARIKSAQMVQDVYDNANSANKQIAYLSLGWDIENCIPGFIENLQKKQVTRSVIIAHQLREEWVANPLQYKAQIQEYLEMKTGYHKIEIPTPEERAIAKSVGTNLTALSKIKVDALMKQASCLTEVQVKLYCPSLFDA